MKTKLLEILGKKLQLPIANDADQMQLGTVYLDVKDGTVVLRVAGLNSSSPPLMNLSDPEMLEKATSVIQSFWAWEPVFTL